MTESELKSVQDMKAHLMSMRHAANEKYGAAFEAHKQLLLQLSETERQRNIAAAEVSRINKALESINDLR